MDKYTTAVNIVNNIRQFNDRINNIDSLLEDLLVRPSPGDEESAKVILADYKSQVIELADDINLYIRTTRQAQVTDDKLLQKEVESLRKQIVSVKTLLNVEKQKSSTLSEENLTLANRVKELEVEREVMIKKFQEQEVEIEKLKTENKDIERLKEVKDYMESLTPWLERFNSNQQRQGVTGQESSRYMHSVEDNKLADAYKASNYKITKQMQDTFGMSYSGIKKRLVSLGEYQYKR